MIEIDEIVPIDLSNIKTRLIKNNQFDIEFVEMMCEEYKKFLYIHQIYPNEYVVPGKLVDEVWHDHILHTKKYENDCTKLFGRYLHHEPTENGDYCDLKPTLKLYKSLFGSDAPNEFWLGEAGCTGSGNCSGRCASCGGSGCK